MGGGGGGKGGGGAPAPANNALAQATQLDQLAKLDQLKAETARIAQEQETARVAAEEKRMTEGRAARDTAIANRRGAEEYSSRVVKEAVAREQASADTRGVKYETTPDQLQSRIGKQFSDIYSEEQQAQYDRLTAEFGIPEELPPGEEPQGGTLKTPGTPARTLKTTRTPATRSTFVTKDEPLGAASTLLGG